MTPALCLNRGGTRHNIAMNNDAASGILQLISAAVTPVVLISACATLILGVNNKHSGIADRIRFALAEYRHSETQAMRREQLAAQLPIFHRRFFLSWLALCALYCAVGLFILTTIVILVSKRRLLASDTGALYLFGLGIVLMLVSVGLEIAETALATRSLAIEMRDFLMPPPPTSGKNAGG